MGEGGSKIGKKSVTYVLFEWILNSKISFFSHSFVIQQLLLKVVKDVTPVAKQIIQPIQW